MQPWSGRLIPASDNGILRRALLALFLLALLATAWVHDDAFISLRSVDNLVAGRGLTWNAGERVQVFTHPLWFFILATGYAVTGEPYYTTLAICLLCSLLAVYLVAFRFPASPREGTLVLAALLLSQGFIDYSTSGLENPLTHLLVVLIVGLGWYRADAARGLLWLAFLTALALLNRLDLLPLLLPPLAVELWRAGARQRLGALAALGLPLLAWEAFSLVYFGFLVPNTAPAKLATAVSLAGKAAQGLNYLASNLIHDGFTIAFGAWLAAKLWRHGSSRGRAAVIGVGLYLIYLVVIGGDYMSGRALAAPFVLFLTCALGEGLLRRHPPRPAWLAVGVMALALRSAAALAGHAVDPFGIGDERRVWHPHTGLLYAAVASPWPQSSAWQYLPGRDCAEEHCLHQQNEVGLVGFYSGPDVYVLDNMALGDAFRAHLPGIRRGDFNRPGALAWRPGHVARPYPAGLLESLATGRNRIEDQDLARFYDAIHSLISGPLWSAERWRAIWRVNSGAYEESIHRWAGRHPELFEPRQTKTGPAWGPAGNGRETGESAPSQ